MLTVQMHTKPVYNKGVHKTSLQYRCTQNQFTVQVTQNQFTVHVYTKPEKSTLFIFFVMRLNFIGEFHLVPVKKKGQLGVK